MTTTDGSVGSDFPTQQARVREVLEQYRNAHDPPGVNCNFAIVMTEAALTAAEQAIASGDIVRILKAYADLTGIE